VVDVVATDREQVRHHSGAMTVQPKPLRVLRTHVPLAEVCHNIARDVSHVQRRLYRTCHPEAVFTNLQLTLAGLFGISPRSQ
jgi:hypothetical protein